MAEERGPPALPPAKCAPPTVLGRCEDGSQPAQGFSGHAAKRRSTDRSARPLAVGSEIEIDGSQEEAVGHVQQQGLKYNHKMLSFLNHQLEKAKGLQRPARATAQDWQDFKQAIWKGDRILRKHAGPFSIQTFYGIDDVRGFVKDICGFLKAKSEEWGLASSLELEGTVPQDRIEEDRKYLHKMLSYILKGVESGIEHDLLLQWRPIKCAHDEKMKSLPIISQDSIVFTRQIGEGGYGVVLEAKWNFARVAVKKLDVEGDLPIEEFAKFVKEVMVHARLNHPNVAQVHGTTPSGWLVMEKADSDLGAMCHGAKKVGWQGTLNLLKQAAEGLLYLHSLSIIHADVKSSNFLIFGTDPCNCRVKITDFGLAVEAIKGRSKTARLGGGTLEWMAPEAYEGQPTTALSDVFGFGVVIYEVITGAHPYGADKLVRADVRGATVMKRKLSNEEPCMVQLEDCPEAMHLFMKRCCSIDPAERPTMREVTQFLQGLTPDWNPSDQPLNKGPRGCHLELPSTPIHGPSIDMPMASDGEAGPLAPDAVLETVRQCKDELGRAQIDHTEEVAGGIKDIAMGGARNMEIVIPDVEKMKSRQDSMDQRMAGDIKDIAVEGAEKLEIVMSSQQSLQSRLDSIDRRMAVPPACIPIAPDAIGLDPQLSVVRSLLFKNGCQYVALIGLGGIGKTTLAQKVVNDPQVQARYPKRAFVVISQEPNIPQCQKRIVQDLLGGAHQVELTSSEDGFLQLQAALKNGEFLLVLDDLWYQHHAKHFMVASHENSRVLITSRHKEVAKYVGAMSKCHHMVGLNNEESMQLFCHHAFAGGQPLNWQRPFVEDIVKECKGLPLALAVMGREAKSYNTEGQTSRPTREEREKWRSAAKSMKQDGVVARDVFDRVFLRSFRSLGDLSRAILLNFAMLPEDYEVIPSDIVDLMCSTGICDEKAAQSTVRELEERSLIICVGKHRSGVPDFQQHDLAMPSWQRCDVVRYRMHDVVRDNALRMLQYDLRNIVGEGAVAASELPFAERDRVVSSQLPESTCQHWVLKLTHFSTTQSITDDQQVCLQDLEMPNLQVVVMRGAGVSEMPVSLLVAHLVALDLTSSNIQELPAQVSVLKSARLLRLDYCDMLESLPSEVGQMEQLSVLSMRGCRSLYIIPESLWRLPRLTKLLAPCCGFAHFLPATDSYLPKLRMLDLSKCLGLKQLHPSFGCLTYLRALNLGGCWQLESLPSTVGQLARLEVLILHDCRSLSEIPASVGDLHELTELDVQGCSNLSCNPSTLADGCLRLRILRLQDNAAMEFPPFVERLCELEVLGFRGLVPPVLEQQLQEKGITLEHSATPEYKANARERGSTPLHWAAKKGLKKMALFHLEETNVDCQEEDGRTPLIWAAENGHAAVAEVLLDRGASVDLVDEEGWTALIWAARNGHAAVAKVLLDRGASADLADKEGWTALMRAAQNGKAAVAEALLDRGASVDVANEDGWTALMGAAFNGHAAVAEVLLDRGASADVANEYGYTALMVAARFDHAAVAEVLLDRGASVDLANKGGQTPLLRAACRGHAAVAELLLDRGASVDLANEDGDTALTVAAQQGHKAVIKLLEKHGATR